MSNTRIKEEKYGSPINPLSDSYISSMSHVLHGIMMAYSKYERNNELSLIKDPEETKKAIDRNTYQNEPLSLKSNSCLPTFFSKQAEFGKAVKPGKKYPNAFFSDLASVNYFHTYIAGFITFGILGGVGKQFTTSEKKKFKTYIDNAGLYQLNNHHKYYIENGWYRYIVSPKGGLYILTENVKNAYHNSIRASQPVQCAGEVSIINKQIVRICNSSGHYRPTSQQLLRTVGGLFSAGFVGLDVVVRSFTPGWASYSTNSIGTVRDLIKQDKILIPEPWIATTEFSNKMKN